MTIKNIAVLLAAAYLLSGCASLIFSGASTAGVVAAQERSTGNAVDDAGIRLRLNEAFLRTDANDMFKNVATRCSEGRVLLSGNVDKPETAVEAVRLAWTVHGVHEVINELQVNDKSGVLNYARDAWISAQIRTKFLLEKNLRSINYNVETLNGVVILLGIAQDQAELNKATYIASTTKYVTQVISHVILKDDPRRQIFKK